MLVESIVKQAEAERPAEVFRFENGTTFQPQQPPPFVPDRNFDGDSVYWITPSASPPSPAKP